VPRAAIERLAEADAFNAIGADRRQGLWKVKGLGEAPLPLFEAADARAGGFIPVGQEPPMALRSLTEGKQVVEDYRTTQLSLRAHPLSFLRADLARRGVRPCADLESVPDGRFVEVAGVVLVRQKPGSAKGVLFVTIEDETGVAQGILWPDRFEAQRRTIMTASMIGLRGVVQKEGRVIHVIIQKVVDYGDLLRRVGEMDFPYRPGPGDGAAHHAGPDPRDKSWKTGSRDLYWPPHAAGRDPDGMVRIRSRNFH